MPPWHHRGFIELIESDGVTDAYSANKRRQLSVELIGRLSTEKHSGLTLQEDLLIRCLFSCHRKTIIINKELEKFISGPESLSNEYVCVSHLFSH